VGKPAPFDGLMGLFEDSLPDGWGRLLMDRRAAKAGISAAAMGPLDRLSLVGPRAMGALVYEPDVALEPPTAVSLPAIEADVEAVLRDAKPKDLDRLVALGGSPQGARPKVLVQIGADGAVIHGDRRHRPGCTHYIVKFRARADDEYAGALEHAYARMAAAAGITIPPSKLLGRTSKHPGFFAIERFDRRGTRKLHVHTVSGLLEVSPSIPTLSYQDLLLLTRRLTRDETQVREMFRRACFNVFAHNRDDHTRNFAFLMDQHGEWRVSPAYDLSYSDGPGGEHAMLVGKEGANPGVEDLVEVAKTGGLKHPDAVLDEVAAAVQQFRRFADEAGVGARTAGRVAAALGLAPARRRR
jgi:serine/threonine-protein kinase HipA